MTQSCSNSPAERDILGDGIGFCHVYRVAHAPTFSAAEMEMLRREIDQDLDLSDLEKLR